MRSDHSPRMRSGLGCPCRSRPAGGEGPVGSEPGVGPRGFGPRQEPAAGGWELLPSPAARHWRKLTRRLVQILRLRGTWHSLGEHLKQFRELKPRVERLRADARRC